MSITDTSATAGWYAVGGGYERYWDGSVWTERLRPVPSYVVVERRQGLLSALADFRDTTPITHN
jgi:hypothetical protein